MGRCKVRPVKKIRLDQLLVARKLVSSREQARRLILAGRVRVRDAPVTKAGQVIADNAPLHVDEPECAFVSRGGIKLAHALSHFNVVATDKVCLDAGASTGGFTDCLLKAGARKIYAVDVGYGQLAWVLRNDPRVVVLERTNLRYITRAKFSELLDLVTLDLSFISLTKIFPPLVSLVAPGATIVALIKPQFEVGKGKVGKGGIVQDAAARHDAVQAVLAAACALGWDLRGTVESPITGADGNVEFLAVFCVSS